MADTGEDVPGDFFGTGVPNVGQVLVHLDNLKADIIREVQACTEAFRTESEALRREVIERLASATAKVERTVLNASGITRSRSHGSRSRGSDSQKRKLPVADEVKDIATVADRDVALLSLMRCAMMFTVFSFVKAFPNASGWVTERLKDNMKDVIPLLNSVSGFSLLFFSVAADDPKARFKSRMGELWSRFCACTIVLMVMTARSTIARTRSGADADDGGEEPVLPAWLSSLGGMKRATSIVREVVECLERTNQVPVMRMAKKREEKLILSKCRRILCAESASKLSALCVL